jgi:hypothetical protein
MDAAVGHRMVDGAGRFRVGAPRLAEPRQNVEFHLPKSPTVSVNSSFAKHRLFPARAPAIYRRVSRAVVQ